MMLAVVSCQNIMTPCMRAVAGESFKINPRHYRAEADNMLEDQVGKLHCASGIKCALKQPGIHIKVRHRASSLLGNSCCRSFSLLSRCPFVSAPPSENLQHLLCEKVKYTVFSCEQSEIYCSGMSIFLESLNWQQTVILDTSIRCSELITT